MKHEITAILGRIAGHARQARDCAMLGERCHVTKPLSRSERAMIRSTVKTHARLMTSWVNKLP